jgi:outer membrane immunogenic protein
MKRLFLPIAIALALPATVATAADLPAFKSPISPEFSWTGFYIGGNGGGAWSSANVSQTLTAPAPFLPEDTAAVSAGSSSAFHPGGGLAGAQIGYNQQWGQFVGGGEIDFDYLGLGASRTVNAPFPSTLPGGAAGPPTVNFLTTTSVSTNWLFTFRPRVGWAVNNWLFYATGGLALGRENFNQTVSLVSPFVETTSMGSTRVGWTAGAGVEYAITKNWSIKGEYLHVDLGSFNTVATLSPAFAGLNMAGNVRLTTEIARGGVNYHF